MLIRGADKNPTQIGKEMLLNGVDAQAYQTQRHTWPEQKVQSKYPHSRMHFLWLLEDEAHCLFLQKIWDFHWLPPVGVLVGVLRVLKQGDNSSVVLFHLR